MTDMQTQIHPDEVLENLKATCGNKRSKENLDKLHEVCRRQKEGKSEDFTLPTLGPLSKKAGGPAYNSLKATDTSGRRFQQLITAWANYTGGVTSQTKRDRKKENEPPKLADLLQKAGVDAALVSLVGRLEKEHRQAVNAVNVCKSQGEVIIDRRKIAHQPAPSATPEVFLPTTITDVEREALEEAISDEFLSGMDWKEGNKGRIKNNKGRTVYKAGYVTALRKILDT
jgi:hypothetical protein